MFKVRHRKTHEIYTVLSVRNDDDKRTEFLAWSYDFGMFIWLTMFEVALYEEKE